MLLQCLLQDIQHLLVLYVPSYAQWQIHSQILSTQKTLPNRSVKENLTMCYTLDTITTGISP